MQQVSTNELPVVLRRHGSKYGTTALNSGARGSNDGGIRAETVGFYCRDSVVWISKLRTKPMGLGAV